MATIVIPIEELTAKFAEACNILQKLRKYEQRWKADYDGKTLTLVKAWQAKADEFLEGLVIEEDENINPINQNELPTP